MGLVVAPGSGTVLVLGGCTRLRPLWRWDVGWDGWKLDVAGASGGRVCFLDGGALAGLQPGLDLISASMIHVLSIRGRSQRCSAGAPPSHSHCGPSMTPLTGALSTPTRGYDESASPVRGNARRWRWISTFTLVPRNPTLSTAGSAPTPSLDSKPGAGPSCTPVKPSLQPSELVRLNSVMAVWTNTLVTARSALSGPAGCETESGPTDVGVP